MDGPTVRVYEEGAAAYRRTRRAYDPDEATAFAATVPEGGVRADLGCGPGLYTPLLGAPVVAVDAAHAMLREVVADVPGAAAVQADLAELPFRRGALAGAWASKSYQHLRHADLPAALAQLHGCLEVGAPVHLVLFAGDGELVTGEDDEFPGRWFSLWSPDALERVVAGAGFDVGSVAVGERGRLVVTARRTRTLPDVVGPGLRLLVCGLNPSLYAADAGVGFARPGNRFWPAAVAAGVVTRPLDPWHAFRHHRVGFTDLAKRATVAAGEVTAAEFREGLGRVDALCRWLAPRALCVVGLTGWRAATGRRDAGPGEQPEPLGGAPVYLMPNPSGRNAHVRPADLAAHLQAAAALADRSPA